MVSTKQLLVLKFSIVTVALFVHSVDANTAQNTATNPIVGASVDAGNPSVGVGNSPSGTTASGESVDLGQLVNTAAQIVQSTAGIDISNMLGSLNFASLAGGTPQADGNASASPNANASAQQQDSTARRSLRA